MARWLHTAAAQPPRTLSLEGALATPMPCPAGCSKSQSAAPPTHRMLPLGPLAQRPGACCPPLLVHALAGVRHALLRLAHLLEEDVLAAVCRSALLALLLLAPVLALQLRKPVPGYGYVRKGGGAARATRPGSGSARRLQGGNEVAPHSRSPAFLPLARVTSSPAVPLALLSCHGILPPCPLPPACWSVYVSCLAALVRMLLLLRRPCSQCW